MATDRAMIWPTEPIEITSQLEWAHFAGFGVVALVQMAPIL